MEKRILPYTKGQKVHVNPVEEEHSRPTRYYEEEDAYINEVAGRMGNYRYSLITIDKNGKYSGGYAWCPHDALTLLEKATISSLKFVEKYGSGE